VDFLGVGVPEFLFILIIALIVLGPRDMVKAGRTLGRFMRKIVTSPSWRTVQQASNEIRTLPNKLMREAGLEEIRKQLPDTQSIGKDMGYDDLQKEARNISKQMAAWTTPPDQADISPDKSDAKDIEETEQKPLAQSSEQEEILDQPTEPSE